MIPLTTTTASTTESRTNASPWMGALYAAIFTAIIAFIFVFTLQAEMPFLYIPAFILIGIGPVLGYQMALGRLGDWKALLGGVLGFLIPGLSIILWPLAVGLLDVTQSFGRLLLGSIVGVILGMIVFFGLATVMGQNPSWFGTGFAMELAAWGAVLGWFAVNYARE